MLKHTPKTNPDHAALEQALAALREVMMHINEDKRKAEGQVTLFNIFNDIDNCPVSKYLRGVVLSFLIPFFWFD